MTKSKRLKAMVEWLPTISRYELERWIGDALWKDGLLPDNDLMHAFEAHLQGVDLRTMKEDNHVDRDQRP